MNGKQNKIVIVCAPTGIAAINIQGVTIHRCFSSFSRASSNQAYLKKFLKW